MRDKGGAQHRARCQAHLRAGDSQLLESLIHLKEAAPGKDREEAQGIAVSKVQEHWGGRVGLVLFQHLCEPGEQGSTGMCGNRETLAQGSSGVYGNRETLAQESSGTGEQGTFVVNSNSNPK